MYYTDLCVSVYLLMLPLFDAVETWGYITLFEVSCISVVLEFLEQGLNILSGDEKD